MREILFRGKRIDNDEWVEGFLVIAEDTFKPDNEKTCFILEADASYFGHGEFSGVERVNPETVGQYIGLTDKNGKKVFEGDILNCITNDFYGSDKYVYNFKVTDITDYEQMGFLDFCYEIEIISNIHDNPEWLKEGTWQ